ncbi:uncharacterized protein LY89DRAFT_580739 [Mollisia scopiformis]|uniref:Zn(2)-C6 fungal-type domain-containing protein n=1 Tax=Mollisia scopiformis TaxID=149040 RepID=A0A194XHN8_MOLSC|nr:uncharacterized protein LY89DRAFT_580739 [Mollisia scopiformis]KUJ19673.1 hypothetical protein LY89DRAFT_580739 [Mollisia scopiformis]
MCQCDEERPRCSRCVRLGKVCPGYRQGVDLIFRNENRNTVSKSRLQKSENSFALSTRGLHPHNQHGSNCGTLTQTLLLRSLFPSQDDQTLCYFYEFMMHTMHESDHSRYLHLQLPTLFSRSRQDSALCLATQAISYAVRYLQSLSALRRAIQDPVEAKSDENLYAILLLCGYETITFDSETSSAWGSHVDGACALLRFRGQEKLSTPLQCNMFLFIRRNAIHGHTQLSRPIDPIFDELADAALPFENPEDRLLSVTIKIPQLQSSVNNIFSKSRWNIPDSDIAEIIRACESLDCELADWANNVSPACSYIAATNLNPTTYSVVPSLFFIPDEIHRYSDFYAARIWNLYRVSRLIIHSILLRAESELCTRSQIDRETLKDIHSQKVVRTLVNGICASVPYLMGYDLAQLKRPTTSINSVADKMWPQDSMVKVDKSKHTGRFSLVWPLYLCSSVPSVPESQRRWMRAQLHWLAENGESYAKLLSKAQSQTLFGRPEDFRFDCV